MRHSLSVKRKRTVTADTVACHHGSHGAGVLPFSVQRSGLWGSNMRKEMGRKKGGETEVGM